MDINNTFDNKDSWSVEKTKDNLQFDLQRNNYYDKANLCYRDYCLGKPLMLVIHARDISEEVRQHLNQ